MVRVLSWNNIENNHTASGAEKPGNADKRNEGVASQANNMPGGRASAQRKHDHAGNDTANHPIDRKAGSSSAIQETRRGENGKNATPSRSDRDQSQRQELEKCAFQKKCFSNDQVDPPILLAKVVSVNPWRKRSLPEL